MSKTNNIDLVRYEYMVYIYILDVDNVKEILLTRDDSDELISNSDHIKWTPVKNMNIDIIETAEGDLENGDVSTKKTKNRICGLFDAEPLDWKYAKITVGDDTNIKHSFAIAKMPRSPIVPIIFEVNE